MELWERQHLNFWSLVVDLGVLHDFFFLLFWRGRAATTRNSGLTWPLHRKRWLLARSERTKFRKEHGRARGGVFAKNSALQVGTSGRNSPAKKRALSWIALPWTVVLDCVLWLHRPRAPGVVMTTSMLLGWWISLFLDSMKWAGRVLYSLHDCDRACSHHHKPNSTSPIPHSRVIFPTLVGYLRSDKYKCNNKNIFFLKLSFKFKLHIYDGLYRGYPYCTAHDGWAVTSYQDLFCPLNKPFCDRLPGCVQVVKAGGWRVFVVENGHFYKRNRGTP